VGITRVGDLDVFEFRSTVPTWRIDIAAGAYRTLVDERSGTLVHYLGEEDGGARLVMDAARQSAEVFRRLFGEPPAGRQGLSIIEVPEGWGSQKADGYVLQEGSAFRSTAYAPHVYHEIAHYWNAIAAREIAAARYFDEAFASYFQALAVRELRGEEEFARMMDRFRGSFARSARNAAARNTPITEYGRAGLGGLSYTKGAWSLHVLHQAVGDEAFFALVRTLLEEHGSQPVNFGQFESLVERRAGERIRVEPYFREWFHGAAASDLLLDDVAVEAMAERYRQPFQRF
jgi:hypothetical protein